MAENVLLLSLDFIKGICISDFFINIVYILIFGVCFTFLWSLIDGK